MIKILQNKFQENIWRFKKDEEVDNNFKKEFKKFKKWKFKKRKINKETVKISSRRCFENEEFKKVKKSEKIEFKKKNLKTLRG